jgi:flagellar assembly factor FliW
MRMGASVNRLESSVFFGTETPEVVDTRFGKIPLQRHNPIIFPRGLLGMPDRFHFFLTEFPSAHMSRFKLLQSLDDYSLSFITLPIGLQNDLVLAEDITAACREMEIEIEHLALLLIVSVQRAPGRVTLTVNARAPIFINSNMRLATQHVFQSDKYQVQQPILP